jgi:DNA-binding HxlR family transcriptional regulator
MPCPVARTLDVIGEWWTLLIVRDALLGARRFDEFKATGIADNILSARLKRLVEGGVLERRPYQAHPERHEYLLTEKGRALVPVIAALRDWGQAWTAGDDRSPRLAHRACGHQVALSLYCDECGGPLTAAEVRPEPAGARGGAVVSTDRLDGTEGRGSREHP